MISYHLWNELDSGYQDIIRHTLPTHAMDILIEQHIEFHKAVLLDLNQTTRAADGEVRYAELGQRYIAEQQKLQNWINLKRFMAKLRKETEDRQGEEASKRP